MFRCLAANGFDPALTSRRSWAATWGWCAPGWRQRRAGVAAATRRELDDVTIRRTDVIVVNSREQAIADEQGDLFDPVQAGFLSWDKVGELGELLNGKIPGRTRAEQITLFKNNAGQGVADVAVASMIYSLARRNQIGMEF